MSKKAKITTGILVAAGAVAVILILVLRVRRLNYQIIYQ